MKQQSDFQQDVEQKLIKFKEEVQFLPSNNEKKKWQYFDIGDNLYPPIKHSFLQYAYDFAVPLHDYVNHVRSSQIFGINLLFPMLNDPKKIGQKILIEIFNTKLKRNIESIESFQYEYSPDEDWLGEWPGIVKPSDYITSVDVLIVCKENDKNIAILLEVKFTEGEFGPCNGITSNGCTNEDREHCENFSSVIKERENCYLHKKYKTRSARKYFNYFNLDNDIDNKAKSCPFINNNQCIRNHALAHALKTNGGMAETYFGLIVYDGNNEIMKYWNEYYETMKESKELVSIRASEIVKAFGVIDKTYKMYFDKRYGI